MPLQPREFIREDFVISTDPSRLDLPWIHNYLANDAYWARGIPFHVFHKSVENSLCFGVYYHTAQVGFGRVISDYATFAYLADVFIAEQYRRRCLENGWLIVSSGILNFRACAAGYWPRKTPMAYMSRGGFLNLNTLNF